MTNNKCHTKSLTRRCFIKSGFAGGAFIAAVPFGRLLSPSTATSNSNSAKGGTLSVETPEMLNEIARKYGGEFGDIHVAPKSTKTNGN